MSNLNNEWLPVCADCGGGTLLSFSDACFSTKAIEPSEIQELFFSEPHATTFGTPKNPISGWTNTGLAANAAINEAAIVTWHNLFSQTTADKVRRIKVIGNLDAATKTDVVGPEGISISVDKTYTITADASILDNLAYAALQKLDECEGEIHLWFRTAKYLYGGINGIKVNVRGANHVLARGGGSIATNVITLSWKSLGAPPRDLWPLDFTP